LIGVPIEQKNARIQNILTHIPHLVVIDGLDTSIDVSTLLTHVTRIEPQIEPKSARFYKIAER